MRRGRINKWGNKWETNGVRLDINAWIGYARACLRNGRSSATARLPRFFAEGQPLHITQRGNNRDPIFAAEPDYLFYLDCLEHAAAEHGLAIHAYVLMTNHVHLLATPSHEAARG